MTSTQTEPAVWFPAIRAGSGADVFTERLVEGLQQRGIRAEITWLPHRAEYAPWTVKALRPPRWTNITHVNTWLHRRFIPKWLPVVATMHHCVHGEELMRFKSRSQTIYHRYWIKPIEKAVLRRADKVIADSRYTAKSTALIFHLPEVPIIHIGIDLDSDFQPSSSRPAHHPFRLLYVGNWSIRKGVDLLAPIMRALGPDFELSYTANTTNNKQPFVLSDNTHCIGRPETATKLANAYRQSDALLFPTRLEGFGLVALEAQACGLPVIATRGSSIPEVVEDGVTGLLCPQDDIQAFSDAARSLAASPEIWQDMRLKARERARQLFSLDTMIDRYLSIYQDCLSDAQRHD